MAHIIVPGPPLPSADPSPLTLKIDSKTDFKGTYIGNHVHLGSIPKTPDTINGENIVNIVITPGKAQRDKVGAAAMVVYKYFAPGPNGWAGIWIVLVGVNTFRSIGGMRFDESNDAFVALYDKEPSIGQVTYDEIVSSRRTSAKTLYLGHNLEVTGDFDRGDEKTAHFTIKYDRR